MRVLIAVESPVVRRGLSEILSRDIEDAECEETVDSQGTVSAIRNKNWDIVLLDLAMLGPNGIDVVKDLNRDHQRRVAILVLSLFSSSDYYGARLLRAGASGYIDKTATPAELIQAIRKVRGGGRYVSSSLAERLAMDLSEDQPLHERLSDREFEVLRMLAGGITTSRIARELHLSGATISTYRARLLEKMKMRTNAELVRYALRNKLID